MDGAGNNPVRLETTRSDADKAKAYREEIGPLLEKVVEVVQRARQDGMLIGFNIAPDQYGIPRVGRVDITKPL